MSDSDDPRTDAAALRNRLSTLTAAILQINASLEPRTVLQAVVDSARKLTEARYGVISTVGESGQPEDFVTTGLTQDERERLVAWPDRPPICEHLRATAGPLRLQNLPEYIQSLGFSSDLTLPKTFQATPMHHGGEHIGHFFLAGKEGGDEFTSEDEETLVLFASQAATAITNARAYRAEKRARADLQALVEASPVGVVVFDAATAAPVLFNRKAKQMAEVLGTSARPPETLLEELSFRRGDGRQVSLSESPLTDHLRRAQSVQAEEIVLECGGRSVSLLINAEPIHAGDGAVESLVVTMQDMAPLEEVERLRAEFLGLVSHELRVPLAAIKGSAGTVLGASPELEPAEVFQFFRIVEEQADHMRGLIADLLDVGKIETGTLSVSPRTEKVAELVDKARSTFLGSGSPHSVQIDIPAGLPGVLADRRRIVQVLNNLLANAARHSPESSPIRVEAGVDGPHVAISVSDDGSGIPKERLPHLFRKYAGMLGGNRTHRAGAAGLGLAICKGLVEAHGGRIWADSRGEGQGARFTFTLPATSEAASAPNALRPDQVAQPRDERSPDKVLVVDDDPQTLGYVRDALKSAGYTPLVTGDPEQVRRLLRTQRPKLLLLDLLLPGTDGIELMERIPELADLPVIFISGYGRDETIATALEAGAADYIVKPFSATELVARVNAALRVREVRSETFVSGDLTINHEERRVTVGDRPVPLTATEYELLRALSLKPGRVVTYDSLLHSVWGGRDAEDPRVVRAIVKKLRRKLGDNAAEPRYVVTVRGVGYRMPNSPD